MALSAGSCLLGDEFGNEGEYYVAYNANGGTGTMQDSVFPLHAPGNLRANDFTRIDYTFEGWALTGTGEVMYMDEESVKELGTAGSTVSLYAVWTPAKFVWVEGGTFMMGDPTVTSNYPPAPGRPIYHQVTLTKGFWMAQYAVTQKEWKDVMGTDPLGYTGDTLPVGNVSWYDAVEFCNARSVRGGFSPAYTIEKNDQEPANQKKWTVTLNRSADGYRLPTEAEWEYAARGGAEGSKTYMIYAGSDDPDEVAWSSENAGGKVQPVGTKKPNGLGLYDMSGNVWEWCWDGIVDYPNKPETDPENPPPPTPNGDWRVLRGGKAGIPAVPQCSSFNRGYDWGDWPGAGFRLVKSW